MNVIIRIATPADYAKILNLYTPYIQNTSYTFEYEAPSIEEFSQRIEQTVPQFPWLVCEIDGQLAGYAYAAPFHTRAAYQWDSELSVYLDEEYHGRRIGKALYRCLIDLLEEQGYYNLYAEITGDNFRSIRLHKSLGFTECGRFQNTGSKFGQWHDLVCLSKQLRTYQPNPEPPLPITALCPAFIQNVLDNRASEITEQTT